LPENAGEGKQELNFDEITRIVDEARSMGCRRWSISGGEPMLRPDFSEIFDYITRKAVSYTLNTNGTLITPEIAAILKRKGTKMVALYGATKETYDHVTRHPGGFEKVMRGFRYLKEAGVGFIVQLIPMRDNWHEWQQMVELAQSLSKHWRVGAAWLYLSASGSPEVNREIRRQRLDPKDVVELDKPDMSYAEGLDGESGNHSCVSGECECLFADCIKSRRDFHIDPYGAMSFCSFIKDPGFLYDLRQGKFEECWETFIPSLASRVPVCEEYVNHCGSCDYRTDCRWCAVYGYLEHGRFSAPVEYLCSVARENRRFKEDWKTSHRRYFEIAGITIQVESDRPIDNQTFHPKFAAFRVDAPGPDMVSIRHHFTLPDLAGHDLGRELYRKSPWAIYEKNGSYIYLGISPRVDDSSLHRVATFTLDHTRARIYNDDNQRDMWHKGNLHSLTMFPSDQILVARLLADRKGFYLHSAGAILNGAGILFVGHSEAGKSTLTKLLVEAGTSGEMEVEILCDDRNIVRRVGSGWRVYGTWSHGDVPLVSPNDAPLRAVCFIEKTDENRLTPLTDRKEITRRLLACIIRPFVTADWWEKTLDLVEQMVNQTDYHVMRFDKTGQIVKSLKGLAGPAVQPLGNNHKRKN
jgi:MoaA/NifB/PqqE/SkfB family radical SAM enzyme